MGGFGWSGGGGGGVAVGETQKRFSSRSTALCGRLPGRASDLRWWFDSGARAGMNVWLERAYGTIPDRFAPGKTGSCRYPTCCGSRFYSRLAGYEDVNDAARLSLGSEFPADRLGEDLGAGSGLDLALEVVRDRGADR